MYCSSFSPSRSPLSFFPSFSAVVLSPSSFPPLTLSSACLSIVCGVLSAGCYLWGCPLCHLCCRLLFGICCLLSVCIASAVFYLPSVVRSRFHCLLSFVLLSVVCCLLPAVLPSAACCPLSALVVSAFYCPGMYCVLSAMYCHSAVRSVLLHCCPLSLPFCAAVVPCLLYFAVLPTAIRCLLLSAAVCCLLSVVCCLLYVPLLYLLYSLVCCHSADRFFLSAPGAGHHCHAMWCDAMKTGEPYPYMNKPNAMNLWLNTTEVRTSYIQTKTNNCLEQCWKPTYVLCVF